MFVGLKWWLLQHLCGFILWLGNKKCIGEKYFIDFMEQEIFGMVSPHETCTNSFVRIYSNNYMIYLLMNDFIHSILKKNYYGYLL